MVALSHNSVPITIKRLKKTRVLPTGESEPTRDPHFGYVLETSKSGEAEENWDDVVVQAQVRAKKRSITSEIMGRYDPDRLWYFICYKSDIVDNELKEGDRVTKIHYYSGDFDIKLVIRNMFPIAHFGNDADFIRLEAEKPIPA